MSLTTASRKSNHGKAPYKSTKDGAGVLSSVSTFNHEKAPCHVYSDLMSSNNNEATAWFEVKF